MQKNLKKLIAVIIIIFALLGVRFFVYWNAYRIPIIAPTASLQDIGLVHEVIGQSVQMRNIDAYTYGNGPTHLLFVGGIHGGYEWNSVLLAYMFMDYLELNPDAIPANVTITIIPSANPDGIFAVVGKQGRFMVAEVSTSTKVLESGRFNARDVDINRNFDCKWQAKSIWRSKTVSAGSEAFSEPEARAIRDYVSKNKISAAIFWHSQSNAVYASQCEDGILPKTLDIMNVYSKAAGYPAVKTFDAYATTGAVDDWLASIGIPAITVELKTHDTIEWDKNLAGIKALFGYFAEK